MAPSPRLRRTSLPRTVSLSRTVSLPRTEQQLNAETICTQHISKNPSKLSKVAKSSKAFLGWVKQKMAPRRNHIRYGWKKENKQKQQQQTEQQTQTRVSDGKTTETCNRPSESVDSLVKEFNESASCPRTHTNTSDSVKSTTLPRARAADSALASASASPAAATTDPSRSSPRSPSSSQRKSRLQMQQPVQPHAGTTPNATLDPASAAGSGSMQANSSVRLHLSLDDRLDFLRAIDPFVSGVQNSGFNGNSNGESGPAIPGRRAPLSFCRPLCPAA
eukprot:g47537.t1